MYANQVLTLHNINSFLDKVVLTIFIYLDVIFLSYFIQAIFYQIIKIIQEVRKHQKKTERDNTYKNERNVIMSCDKIMFANKNPRYYTLYVSRILIHMDEGIYEQ